MRERPQMKGFSKADLKAARVQRVKERLEGVQHSFATTMVRSVCDCTGCTLFRAEQERIREEVREDDG